MRRRTLIKQLFVVSAGMALVPACREDRAKAGFLYKNLKIGPNEEALLAELAEAIIPKTTTPGAKDISAHLFALKMMDDCRSAEEQQAFLDGLRAFSKSTADAAGRNFEEMDAAQRTKFLEALEQGDKKDLAAAFYQTMKKLTIQAYTNSEYYMTKVQVYEMVPGRYHGCVPVKAI